tara:strand:- start:1285 stop:2808 length:1524 start_codon:yes stop_codon:yes gene_type:complete
MVKIARNIKKVTKPLGGIGAQAQDKRTHSLVLDDRLLSKQYITNRVDAKVSDAAFGGSWADITDVAPSKGAVQAYLNSLEVTAGPWSQEDASAADSKSRTADTGNVGIGAGSGLAYSSITERLTVDGNIKGTGNLITGTAGTPSSLSFLSDSSQLKFGVDNDTILTHTDGLGLTLNDTNKLCFNDGSQFIQGSSTAILSIGATDEIDLTATEIEINGNADINGDADISGALTVSGNTTISGNLTVTGTATSIETTTLSTSDNIMVLNKDVTGTPSENAGLEIERGTSDNVAIRWNESTDKWQLTNDGSTYSDISTGASAHDAITIDNQSLGLLSLSGQAITVNDVMVKNSGDTMTGQLVLSGTSGGSGTTALSVTGGNSAASNAAVSITGHLEATTKSFNIPHPLHESKRLVYGSLEGPEHGMYARGSFDVVDERRKVAIDLPLYWSNMVYPDYTVNVTTYGDYNVWISERNGDGFWVETNSEEEWSFDWNVIGGRKDAKLEVEPDA